MRLKGGDHCRESGRVRIVAIDTQLADAFAAQLIPIAIHPTVRPVFIIVALFGMALAA